MATSIVNENVRWVSLMCCSIAAIVVLILLRLYFTLKNVGKCSLPSEAKEPLKTMVIMGSGGHTTEMLRLLSGMSNMYSPRVYIIADTDKMSQEKVFRFEQEKNSKEGKEILCNGPGTCIPLCAAGLTMTFLGLKRVYLIYVESICRVLSLSLSGKILYHLADKMFVQWPELQKMYPKTLYIDRIV
uniref:UDP-N-acetylglucosamine transferase subunit ALG14 n=1 Tax=Saccoglossus kowalevskii TaxID=10224 RepID=A0ABM0MPV8_SACKO|nr:PREDICTED: UDP-N-acetylglucosamine transferase subunit ALG14 homolog [Saccoglossus kowalevskii]